MITYPPDAVPPPEESPSAKRPTPQTPVVDHPPPVQQPLVQQPLVSQNTPPVSQPVPATDTIPTAPPTPSQAPRLATRTATADVEGFDVNLLENLPPLTFSEAAWIVGISAEAFQRFMQMSGLQPVTLANGQKRITLASLLKAGFNLLMQRESQLAMLRVQFSATLERERDLATALREKIHLPDPLQPRQPEPAKPAAKPTPKPAPKPAPVAPAKPVAKPTPVEIPAPKSKKAVKKSGKGGGGKGRGKGGKGKKKKR
ncbi:hypothetical protein ACQZV8_10060 [Magnetococcales bacterium HHB-1]